MEAGQGRRRHNRCPRAKQNSRRLDLDVLKASAGRSLAQLAGGDGGEDSVKVLADSSSSKSTTARRGPGRMRRRQLRVLAVQDWLQARLQTVDESRAMKKTLRTWTTNSFAWSSLRRCVKV